MAAGLVLSGIVAAAGVLAIGPALRNRGSPPVTGWDTRGRLSGLPWLSGVHLANELAPYLAFGAWRDRPVDVALVFTSRDRGWGPISEPDWPVDDFAAFPGKLVISQPTFPEGQGSNAACARGAYDEHWRRFGSFLTRKNRADSIVRIGWEFNGMYMYWHADADARNFTECFRRIAVAIRSANPKVRIDWTFNAHSSPVPASGNPWDAYPGDAYVDVVGIDAYDHYPPARDEAAWQRQCDSVNGLCDLIRFARAHGRKVGVGEWGVTSCGGDAGGDNPFYVRKMYDSFMTNADVIGYESYFHDSSPDNVCSTIMYGGRNARSAAEYKRLFGRS
ncbi:MULTISPECIES: glycoside hydrolase family 26 protein [unclassified Frankia]|uniref:glycoside hydrolase family 26 protein n=1 Tax=unclassified Frankia TaxID=2632575 RepID=UPI001EF4DD54|nr:MULTISPECIES: glycosyl hydrolase [unclassified Frankia]